MKSKKPYGPSSPARPPRLAVRLLSRILPEEEREGVLGDLEELWGRSGATSLFRRRLRYWIQAVGMGLGFSRHWVVIRMQSMRSGNSPRLPSPPRRNSWRSSIASGCIPDARWAVRALCKRPLFTTTIVLTLAMGIGATTSVFSAADALLFRPLPFPEPQELVYVPLVVPPFGGRPELEVEWSYPKYRLLMESTSAFERATTYRSTTSILTQVDNPEELQVELVGPEYFTMLGIEMVEGRPFLREENQVPGAHFVAILSHELWARVYQADPDIVGRSIYLNDRPYTVVGVAQPGFRGLTEGGVQMWVPVMTTPASILENPDNHSHNVLARLKDGVSLDQARAQLEAFPAVLAAAFPPSNPNLPRLGVRARALADFRSAPSMRRAVLFLLGAVGTVLLIACVNLANLLLVQARSREKEMATRVALGAGRGRLVQQLITESLILTALGGALGITLAVLGTPVLRTMALRTQGVFPTMETDLTSMGFSQITLDGRALLFTVGLSLVVATLFGLAPALTASRPDLTSALKEGVRTSARGRRIGIRSRSLLVATQVAFAFALLACGGLMIRSLASLLRSDVGFQADNVLSARIFLPRARYDARAAQRFWADLLGRARSLPGVRSAGMNYCPPLSDRCRGSFVWFPDRPPPPDGIRPMVGFHIVGGDYFGTLGIPLLRGRSVGAMDREGTPLAAMVGQSTAEAFWPGEDPIGRVISIDLGGFGDVTVVGVVGDVHYTTVEAGAQPAIYTSVTQAATRAGYLLIKAQRDPADVLPSVRSLLKETDPDLPLTDVKTMPERVADATAPTRFTAILLSLFAAAALVLSGMGIFGVLALVVRERTHELGVRRALGAQRGDLLRIVLARSARMVGTGLVLGTALAWVSSRLTESLLFGVRPNDPATFAAVGALLSLCAALASLLPAFRATTVDPLVAIQEE